MSSVAKLVLALMWVGSMAGCSTQRGTAERRESHATHSASGNAETTIRDRFDSIYVLHDRQLNVLRDTVWATERITEYRYRLVHDTVLVTRTDTLLRTDSLAVSSRPPPASRSLWPWARQGRSKLRTWLDLLAYASLALLVLFLLYCLREVASKDRANLQ